MIIHIPVSIGELLDKISILQIKSENITDHNKLLNIRYELQYLHDILGALNIDDYHVIYDELYATNNILWKLENNIRQLMLDSEFSVEFIKTSVGIHDTNDERYRIKSLICRKYDSDIFEEKSY